VQKGEKTLAVILEISLRYRILLIDRIKSWIWHIIHYSYSRYFALHHKFNDNAASFLFGSIPLKHPRACYWHPVSEFPLPGLTRA
jgi:hypothetical protein